MGKQWKQCQTLFFGGSKITADGDCSHEIKRHLLLGRKVMTNLDSIFKSRDITCQQRSVDSRLWFFQWSCVDVKVGLWRNLSAEELMLLNCSVGNSPLDCKEVQPAYPKGDQSWMFFGRTDAKAETAILCPPHAKSWLIGKNSDPGRNWVQEKGMTEDEMAGWHHWLDGCEFDWTPGVGDGQGGMTCCDSCDRKESDTTEQMNWT